MPVRELPRRTVSWLLRGSALGSAVGRALLRLVRTDETVPGCGQYPLKAYSVVPREYCRSAVTKWDRLATASQGSGKKQKDRAENLQELEREEEGEK